MQPPDEFGLIKRLFLPLTGGDPAALALADDVALIDGPAGRQWAITNDAIIAGVHFLPDDPADLIARKLVRVTLSDLAAKGATPKFLLLSAGFPKDSRLEWLDLFASGLKSDCGQFKVLLIGGDTVATPGPLTLSLTAIGEITRNAALLRSAARVGDNIWVSGSLGDSALGLRVAKGEVPDLTPQHADYLLERYRLPRPRLALGRALLGLAHAAMDVSDGLLADLGHICDCSHVGAEIQAASLPRSPSAAALFAMGGYDEVAILAGGGDDYELLFTAAPAADEAIDRLSVSLDLPLSRIGRITDVPGVTLLDPGGAAVRVARRGYQHFGVLAP